MKIFASAAPILPDTPAMAKMYTVRILMQAVSTKNESEIKVPKMAPSVENNRSSPSNAVHQRSVPASKGSVKEDEESEQSAPVARFGEIMTPQGGRSSVYSRRSVAPNSVELLEENQITLQAEELQTTFKFLDLNYECLDEVDADSRNPEHSFPILPPFRDLCRRHIQERNLQADVEFLTQAEANGIIRIKNAPLSPSHCEAFCGHRIRYPKLRAERDYPLPLQPDGTPSPFNDAPAAVVFMARNGLPSSSPAGRTR